MAVIALQADPIEKLNRASDSTLALGFAAQERGHRLLHYTPDRLVWKNDGLHAGASSLTLHENGAAADVVGPLETVDLSRSVDVILLRQDPPYDMTYLTTTWLLDRVKDRVRVVNDPAGVRDSPEKMGVTRFPHLMAPTRITADRAAIDAFCAGHKQVVVKRLYGNAGREVWRFAGGEGALAAFLDDYFAKTAEPLLLQPYLPEVQKGDKRVILFGGEVAGAVNRLPAKGSFLANFAQGGTGAACDLTARDLEICEAVGPVARELGLYFVGLDIIGDYLSEINGVSPTGIVSINTLYGLTGDARLEHRFWQGLGL